MALAESQHGVVAHPQLISLGLTARSIGYRVEQRRLHPIHRGVYAVGTPTLTQRGRWMAAVLAAGPDAALSHRAAGALRKIVSSTAVEVTAPASRRRRDGMAIHRAALPADEVTVVDGIPATTVPRTLLDLASVLPRDRLERAIHEAEVKRLTDVLSLPDLLHRYPRRKGTKALREILADGRLGLDATKEELEHLFRAFIAELGLPRPRFNLHVEGFECDVVWPEARLVVELDGRAFHDNPRRFETDRLRDRRLWAADWRPIRVTWRQLHEDRSRLADDLTRMTSYSAGGPPGRASRRAPAPIARTPPIQST